MEKAFTSAGSSTSTYRHTGIAGTAGPTGFPGVQGTPFTAPLSYEYSTGHSSSKSYTLTTASSLT